VARFAEEVGLPNLLLTHFSARFGNEPGARPSIESVRREAAEAYSGRLFLAEDLAAYALDRAGRLDRRA
jgi:ribonuclease Z